LKRIIDYYLLEWKNRKGRKPLLISGVSQVGKTYSVRQLGKTFSNFIEINLELNKAARDIVEKDLDSQRIIFQLSELLQEKITPGLTLLFFDEIQNVPQAIIALRYFYEIIPDLHVVAAGSLLDFAIEQVGVPVGRVSFLYMYPMSFLEFLVAKGHLMWAQLVIKHSLEEPLNEPVHEKLLDLIGEYVAIGGMPEAIKEWIKTKTSRSVKIVHSDLISNYKQDFGRYAKKHQIKYLDLLFQNAIEQLANKFMFSRVGEYKKRELEPALELLEKAGILYKIIRSSGQGIPIGAQADLSYFKMIFLDVGLSQALLKLDLSSWFIDTKNTFINKGEIIEAFAGQEILAYSDPIIKESLFYWQRESRGSEAEIDYLIQINENVIPIEVKGGVSQRIKSMHIFLDSHLKSPYGIRFSAQNYSLNRKIHSYPLYAIIKPFFDVKEDLRNAVFNLLK
jgi:predicted AAA+ superfamily ATPase